MALAWEDLSALACGPEVIKQHGSDRLWRLFGPLIEARHLDQRFVIAQLGQSLDGRIAAPSGHSHYINGDDALDHLHRLRALVDAVVVGASTIAMDDPSLTVRRVAGSSPARVVIDPNRRVDISAKLFADDGAGKIIVGPARAGDPLEVRTIPPNKEGLYPPAWIARRLGDLGLKRLLIEGGAMTVSNFITSKAIDRLHILTGPIIIGSGPVGLNLPEIVHLRDAIRPETTVFAFEGGDVLFDCKFTRDAER